MQISLSTNSYLCELNFKETDIERCKLHKNRRGKLIEYPNKQTRLREKDGQVNVSPIALHDHLMITNDSTLGSIKANHDIYQRAQDPCNQLIFVEKSLQSNEDNYDQSNSKGDTSINLSLYVPPRSPTGILTCFFQIFEGH